MRKAVSAQYFALFLRFRVIIFLTIWHRCIYFLVSTAILGTWKGTPWSNSVFLFPAPNAFSRLRQPSDAAAGQNDCPTGLSWIAENFQTPPYTGHLLPYVATKKKNAFEFYTTK